MKRVEVLVTFCVVLLKLSKAGRFRLGSEKTNDNGARIVQWLQDDNTTWSPILGGCFTKSKEKSSTRYAGRACKENGFLGGWEELISVVDTTFNQSTKIVRVNCDRGDESEDAACIGQVSKCDAEYIGGVRCFNTTRLRHASCNTTSSSYLEVFTGREWLKVCRSNSLQNASSLCRTLGLDTMEPDAVEVSQCNSNLTGNRFHGCPSALACDDCTVRCSVHPSMTCESPGPAPTYGSRLSGSPNFQFGAIVNYSCNPGYELQGAHRLECIIQGLNGGNIWDAKPPKCIQVSEDHDITQQGMVENCTLIVPEESDNTQLGMVENCSVIIILMTIIVVAAAVTLASVSYMIYLGCYKAKGADKQ